MKTQSDTHTPTHTRACMHTHTRAHTHTHRHTHTHTHPQTHTHKHTHTRTHTHTDTHTHTHLRKHIYTRTHTTTLSPHRCICGSLASKARVLVTHQTQFLSRADQVLVLGPGGLVSAQGTYEELVKEGVEFENYRNLTPSADSQDEGVAALRRQSIMRRKSVSSGRRASVRRWRFRQLLTQKHNNSNK